MRTLLKTTISIIILLTLSTTLSASWYDTLSQTKQTKIDKLPLTDYNQQSGVAYTLKVLFNSKIYVNKYRVKQDACPQNSIRWKYLRDATRSEIANLNNLTECAIKRGTHKHKPTIEKVSPPNPNLNTAKVQAWNKQSGAKETKRVLFDGRIYTNKWWVDRHHCPKYAGTREIAWKVERSATKAELHTIYNPTTCEGGIKAVVSPRTLTNLTLHVGKTSINKDTNTTLKVIATYSDKTTKDVINSVEWITNPINTITIKDKTLIATKDTNTTLQAKLNNKLSKSINLELYWEVNGHRLPPEPNKTVNDSTLLGIDVNNNDVRDDVERWIYKEYKDKHPIHVDIAMQAARGYKLVLESPYMAKEIHDEVRKARHCEFYYKYDARYFNEPLLVEKDFDTKYLRKKIYLNTKERKNVYIQYDSFLSGDSYTLPKMEDEKKACDFNTNKYK